jgi:predicted metal-binding protein
MENNYETLMDKAIQLGATGAKLIQTDQVIFDPRSYLKCRFGCNRWGQYWTCPPNLDISPKDFQTAYDRYHSAIVIRTSDPKVGQEVTLAIEKAQLIAEEFHLRLETTQGSLVQLENTLKQALSRSDACQADRSRPLLIGK